MKKWISDILVPYRAGILTKKGLPQNSKVIIYWDVYSVHISAEMRDWVRNTYSWIILIYVPAGCTGVLQPCDVGLRRVFKHWIKHAATRYFCELVQKMLEAGIEAGKIRVVTDLGTFFPFISILALPWH